MKKKCLKACRKKNMNTITTTKITMMKIRTIIMTKTKNITTMTRTAMIKSIIMMTRSTTTMTAKKALKWMSMSGPLPPTPVSYTHLDVYKRQVLLRRSDSSAASGVNCSPVLEMNRVVFLSTMT